jgi:phosphate:Na+ symporter
MNGLGLSIAMSVLGGLGIFMLGMKYMSEGMQAIAGNSLRRMISLVTNNRFLAVAVGTGVTMAVQSSSITTVIVVGLVNAGLMQLHQAIGVIMGANIGTTITGWILVLQIGKFGLPILGGAALVYLFVRRDRPRFIAMAVMGLGMAFFGLELMKNGFAPVKDIPLFTDAFSWFEADSFSGALRAALVGCLLTLIVQSSSATLGITIGLAATGAIPFVTAAALVLGENLGTTITAVLASFGSGTDGKRSAYAHVLFNLIGVTWILLIFGWYSGFIAGVVEVIHGMDPRTLVLTGVDDPVDAVAVMTAAIALTHTGFNLANTLLFLPFVGQLGRLLERLIPYPEQKEVSHLRLLEARRVSAPVLALEQSRGEVLQMGFGTIKMMDWIREVAFSGRWDSQLVEKTFRREDVLDNMNREIVTFLTDLLDTTMPHSAAEEGREQVRVAHEYESISDRLAGVLRGFGELRDKRLELPATQQHGLLELHDEVAAFLRQVTDTYEKRAVLNAAAAQQASAAISLRASRLQDEHVQRMIEDHVDPNLTLLFTAMLTDYRRVRAHTLNIHQAITRADAPPDSAHEARTQAVRRGSERDVEQGGEPVRAH